MPTAPRERPPVATVLGEYSAFISDDANTVFDALARRVKSASPPASSILIDKAQRLVVLQGEWWYRGEWRVTVEAAGSDMEYTIVNVAQRARWAGRLTARGVLKKAPSDFLALASAVRDELE
jgi:hypothetical protein